MVTNPAKMVEHGIIVFDCAKHGVNDWCENYGCHDLRHIAYRIRERAGRRQ